MDHSRIRIQLLPERKRNHASTDKDRAALQTKILEIIQYLDDRLTLERNERIIRQILCTLLIPAVDIQLALRDNFRCNRLILSLCVVLAEAVQMILLGMIFPSRQPDEIFACIDIVCIITIRAYLERCAFIAQQHICHGFLQAGHAERSADFLKISQQACHSLIHLFLRTIGLHRENRAVPFRLCIENLILYRPHNMVRFAPHIKIGEIEMGILIIPALKKCIKYRLVFLC